MYKRLLAALLLAASANAESWPLQQTEQLNPEVPAIPPLRERAKLQDAWTRERLETLALPLMREAKVDMWILTAREYNDDPVLQTMLDAESFTARRTTILVLTDPCPPAAKAAASAGPSKCEEGSPQANQPERLTVSRYGLGGLFEPAWNPARQPDQWKRLAELIRERDPKRIAINVSPASAFADGLTKSQHDALTQALGPDLSRRLVSADPLAIRWLETRTPSEMAWYPMLVRTAHAIMAEGLSNKAITPGKTSVADLEWWLRERISELKLGTWFHPGIAIFRQGSATDLSGDTIFQPGDMVWLDFGITALGLNTDTQHLAYILKPGETDAPAGLKAGLANANRIQDAVTGSFRTGATGNDILLEARKKALAQGLNPTIYSHPIGTHGHAAGAAIGFWDDQKPSPRGDHPTHPQTAWSIELSQTQPVPEWNNQQVQFRTEEDGYFDGRTFRYMDGRQTRFRLIRPQ
ncbi:M24 family metallopeptidase [Sandaracinobacteroides hominis]|uniref:M24 family metallopeptidase n=1 Tax=Sandaracinobacteroides hominis TaxID=2780086 RepID=UPI0018F3DB74|nr:M24 family metallopeptidase [Sandaracinobacteroides hominis]